MLKVADKFELSKYEDEGQYKPSSNHTYGMYIDRKWYELTAKEGIYKLECPVDMLDVSILQNNL